LCCSPSPSPPRQFRHSEGCRDRRLRIETVTEKNYPIPAEGFPSACSSPHWVKVADETWGREGYLLPLTQGGVYYFSCQMPQHCENGMFFSVTVSIRKRLSRHPSECRNCRGGEGEGEQHNTQHRAGGGEGEGDSRRKH